MSSAQFRQLPVLELSDEQLQERVPLGPEGELCHGKLDNGLTYYVRKCSKPPQRAAMALVLRVGSVVEQEQERGVAHIVEHLAFNGTEAYTRHDVVRFLESIGAEFGACSNAVTSVDSTIYELEVPTDDEDLKLLRQAAGVLGQFAFRIRCDGADLARERGPVLEEWRSSRNSAGRAAEAHWKLLLAGSRYAERLPIGLESVIKGVAPEVVKDFFQRWYRPENMALVVVGDFPDADAVASLVQEEVGGLQPWGPGPAPPIPCFPRAPHAEPRIGVFQDAEAQQPAVYVSFTHDVMPLASPAHFKAHLTLELLMDCLSTRLFKLSRKSDPPFFVADMGEERVCAAAQLLSASASISEDSKGAAERALQALLTELARARLHGFSEREVAIARAKVMSDAEAVFLEKDQAYCVDLRDEYVRHFLDDEFVTDPVTEVRLYKTLLPGITPDHLKAAAQQFLGLHHSCVIKLVAHKRLCREEQLQAIVQAVNAAEQEGAIGQWQEDAHVPDAILDESKLPVPGSVVARRELPLLGAVELELSNGMKVTLKSTDFLDDQVLMTGFAPGGLVEVEETSFRSAALATTLAGELGCFGHKPHVMPDLLAGRRVEAKVSVGPYWTSFGGEQSPLDLEAALQLVHALFTTRVEPVEEELRTCMQIAREATLAHVRNPLTRFADRVREINYGRGHHYFRPPREADIQAIRPAAACAFFNQSYADPAAFRLVLTGHITEEEVVPLLEKYVACLPRPEGAQPPRDPQQLSQLPIDFPTGVVEETVHAPMITPQSTAQVTLPVVIGLESGREEVVWLGLLARLLETRLLQALRFEGGEVYSVGVSPFFGFAGPASQGCIKGELAFSFSCDPSVVDALRERALQVLTELQETGPTQEEVTTLLTLEQRGFEKQQHENTYFHDTMVGGYQSKSYQLVGDLDAVYRLRLAARDKVLQQASQDAVRQALRRLLPYPARSRYTAVTLLPRAALAQRVAGVLTQWHGCGWLMLAAAAGVATILLARKWTRK